MKYYIEAIRNYAVFKGRATRKEFWMFTLFNFLIAIAISSIVGIMEGHSVSELDSMTNAANTIYMLFILLPTISIAVRRLHDLGLNGWWWFISFIPLFGPIIIIVLACRPSEPFMNEYGLSHIAPVEVMNFE